LECGVRIGRFRLKHEGIHYDTYHTDEVFWNRSRRSSIVAFAYRGIPYTSREKVIDVDPVKATASQKVFPISPLLIGLALVSGAVLIVAGSEKS